FLVWRKPKGKMGTPSGLQARRRRRARARHPLALAFWPGARGAGAGCVTCPELEPLIERPTTASSHGARMSPNTTTIIHAGLDIAKANLQLHLAGQFHDLPNTPAGHRAGCSSSWTLGRKSTSS